MNQPARPSTVPARLAAFLGLDRAPRLKAAIKRLVYALQDPLRRGIPLHVGGVDIRVPPRFARKPWTDYESASTAEVARWLVARADACLLDVGCSVGIYSLLALALSPRATAYAFDSDLVSLNSTPWLCSHAGPERLRLIHGFVSEKPDRDRDADAAVRETAAQLARTPVPREPESTAYICINGEEHPGVPVNSIDALFPAADSSRPWLLKCDVEGAEVLVLKGADRFLKNARPQLLISVHPQPLLGFGSTKEELRRWIEDRGYGCRILAIDHEEHWWCEPRPRSAD